MFFDKLSDAKAYARSQTQDTRGIKHKAVKCRQWVFCRKTGEYSLRDKYTVVMA